MAVYLKPLGKYMRLNYRERPSGGAYTPEWTSMKNTLAVFVLLKERGRP